jgi:hypothetical protein
MHEIRRENGSRYRAKSVFEFVLAIQTYVEIQKNISLKFLKNETFVPIRNALDNIMKELQTLGLGFNPKKAEVISTLVEEELWRGGHLGVNSSQLLLRTVVYTLGLNLALRAGEHRRLRREMFEVRDYFQLCDFV